MKYARIVDDIAVDVVTAPPDTLFTPSLAQLFVVVPDIEPGSVRLQTIEADVPTNNYAWFAPRTFIEEFEPGRFRHSQRDEAPPVLFPADPGPRNVTRLAFISRFTDAEWIAFDLASAGDTPQAAAMRLFIEKVRIASFIDLNRADTRAGVHALEAATLIGLGRAVEILDAPIQPHEAYKE